MAFDDTLIVDHIKQTHDTDLLSEREKHLIGLAVTMTRGCQVCTRNRIEKARSIGLTDDEIATITANQVDAITQRSRDIRERQGGNPLDLQGNMEIEQLRAEGEVYLATPLRRADAHEVDYDTRTQIATLTARPGRKVSIMTEGSPLPVKATKMVWNMDPLVDSIQLVEPSGTGVR